MIISYRTPNKKEVIIYLHHAEDIAQNSSHNDPQFSEEVLCSLRARELSNAMEEECCSLIKNNVFEVVEHISRPDISFAIDVTSRFNKNLNKWHWEAVKRILRTENVAKNVLRLYQLYLMRNAYGTQYDVGTQFLRIHCVKHSGIALYSSLMVSCDKLSHAAAIFVCSSCIFNADHDSVAMISRYALEMEMYGDEHCFARNRTPHFDTRLSKHMTCGNNPFILALPALPPCIDALVIAIKAKAELIAKEYPLHDSKWGRNGSVDREIPRGYAEAQWIERFHRLTTSRKADMFGPTRIGPPPFRVEDTLRKYKSKAHTASQRPKKKWKCVCQAIVNRLLESASGNMNKDDNVRCPVSRATMQWYADNNVRRLDWSVQSPDLNHIEQLWDELDRRVRARQDRPKSVAQLMEWLQEECDLSPLMSCKHSSPEMRLHPYRSTPMDAAIRDEKREQKRLEPPEKHGKPGNTGKTLISHQVPKNTQVGERRPRAILLFCRSRSVGKQGREERRFRKQRRQLKGKSTIKSFQCRRRSTADVHKKQVSKTGKFPPPPPDRKTFCILSRALSATGAHQRPAFSHDPSNVNQHGRAVMRSVIMTVYEHAQCSQNNMAVYIAYKDRQRISTGSKGETGSEQCWQECPRNARVRRGSLHVDGERVFFFFTRAGGAARRQSRELHVACRSRVPAECRGAHCHSGVSRAEMAARRGHPTQRHISNTSEKQSLERNELRGKNQRSQQHCQENQDAAEILLRKHDNQYCHSKVTPLALQDYSLRRLTATCNTIPLLTTAVQVAYTPADKANLLAATLEAIFLSIKYTRQRTSDDDMDTVFILPIRDNRKCSEPKSKECYVKLYTVIPERATRNDSNFVKLKKCLDELTTTHFEAYHARGNCSEVKSQNVVVAWRQVAKGTSECALYLSSLHEKEDTKINLHAIEAKKFRATQLDIISPDTDVLVLALSSIHHFHKIQNTLSLEVERGTELYRSTNKQVRKSEILSAASGRWKSPSNEVVNETSFIEGTFAGNGMSSERPKTSKFTKSHKLWLAAWRWEFSPCSLQQYSSSSSNT
ncbi:hypothetical protein PR048_015732 [Dryococelus australis]|uniref:Uncharacterized protein n=1 Tax=Dryococelus australis TaxID=614101 RepID=A0ABQ9HHS1_9NEOP|nr:hypothetical protein PR048_015732 [Dryococelus australis]